MRITANQVTIGRIVLLPIPTGMLLFGPVELHFIALFMFIAIGLADIWDGMLARRQGPTQFG
ncbi:MAG: CDP-alcohol phosphatidyltransferase family protein, partial [Pseudomonadota bacterium]